MKKNIITLFLTLFLCTATATQAATKVEVEAITPFSTLKPTQTMKVITHQKVEFENGVVFEDGTVVTGNIIEVIEPKRGKRNASFKFQPTTYFYNGKTTKIYDDDFVAKYKEKKDLNKGEMALSAATTAGGFLFNIPGLSQGVSMLKGMVKNQEDNRLKSGVKQVYKDSPLAYVEEGKDVEIRPKDIFYLKFKTNKSEDIDNEDDTDTASLEEPVKQPVSTDNQTSIEVNNQTQQEDFVRSPQNLKFTHPDEVLKEVELNSKWENFINFFVWKLCNNLFTFKHGNIGKVFFVVNHFINFLFKCT